MKYMIIYINTNIYNGDMVIIRDMQYNTNNINMNMCKI